MFNRGQIVLALIAITVACFSPTLRAADIMEFQKPNGNEISSGANEAYFLQVSDYLGDALCIETVKRTPSLSMVGFSTENTTPKLWNAVLIQIPLKVDLIAQTQLVDVASDYTLAQVPRFEHGIIDNGLLKIGSGTDTQMSIFDSDSIGTGVSSRG